MEVLQQAMIKYYGITLEETGGNAVFVLKLNECQVVKDQILKRFSVTLMSRALKESLWRVKSWMHVKTPKVKVMCTTTMAFN